MGKEQKCAEVDTKKVLEIFRVSEAEPGKPITFEFEGKTYELDPKFYRNSNNTMYSDYKIGRAITEIVYADKLAEGFNFCYNVLESELPRYLSSYQSGGWNAFVGDRAFWLNGHEDPRLKALLERKLDS